MEQILLPTGVEFIPGTEPNVAEIIVTPCHQGYGTTLGNALRRILLSSLPGAAVEAVKINGVQHEFSTIEGVTEDVIDIILNLKQLAVKSHSDEPVILKLSKKGIGEVTAADFEKNADVEIFNPDLKICTIANASTKVEMEVEIGRGRGYRPVEEKRGRVMDLGTILVDSLYSPIRDVGYKVEMTRVGDVTNYEKLIMHLETNGTMSPKQAMNQSVRLLLDHLEVLEQASLTGVEEEVVAPVVESEEKPKKIRKSKKADKEDKTDKE
ncbi:MAG TPA: DNA-directed RNA polymerase subunit alpha [Patescibacteria group bacterium]|nr:DNA-directed RNA polymerase subunit alpha [Patescibacteria group bacterium]